MAIRFTPEGLQSYAPGIETNKDFISKITGGRVKGSGGGSSGSSSGGMSISPEEAKKQEAAKKAAEEEAKRQAEVQRQLEIKLANERAAAEQKRLQEQLAAKRMASSIELQKNIYTQSGGITTNITSRDVRTGDNLEISTTYKKGNVSGQKVVEVKNLTTGETKLQSYEVPKGGGSVRLAGGVTIIDTTKKVAEQNEKNFIEKLEEAKKIGEKKLDMLNIDSRIYSPPKKDSVLTTLYKSLYFNPKQTIAYAKANPVETLSTVAKAPMDTTVQAFEYTAEKGKLLFPEQGFSVTVPERKEQQFKYYEPQFGTITDESKSGMIEKTGTIAYRPETKVKIFERQKVKESIAMGGVLGATIALPYLYAPGFVVSGVKTASDTSKSAGERALGVAEAGLGASIIGGRIFEGVVTGIKGEAWVKNIKQNKYIRNPQEKTVELKQSYAVEQSTQKLMGVETKTSNIGNDNYLSLYEKLKSKTNIKQQIPKNEWVGTVKESRKTSIFGKLKDFDGKVEIKGGKYIETIKYDKGITKVTKLDSTGKGTSSLLQDGKIIKQVDIQDASMLDKLKMQTIKRKPIVYKQSSLIGTETRTVEATQYGRLTIGSDFESGIKQNIETSTKKLDILRASPKRNVRSVKINEKSITQVKETPVEIVFVESKPGIPKDWTKYQESENIKFLRTKIEPKVSRNIAQAEESSLKIQYKEPVKKGFIEKTKQRKVSFKNVQDKDIAVIQDALQQPPKSLVDDKLITIKDTAKVYVEKSANLLKDVNINVPNIPIITTPIKQTVSYVKGAVVRASTTPITTTSYNSNSIFQTVSASPVEEISPTISFNSLKVQSELTKPQVIQVSVDKQIPKTETIITTTQLPKSITISGTKQISKTKQKQIEITIPKIVQKTIQITKPTTTVKLKQPKPPKPEPPIIKPIIKLPSTPKRLLTKIKEEPEKFEALGIRFGKEVKLGTGTKEQAASKLSKFLTGTLGASGYLKTGGQKIKAEETSLLKSPTFRVGKKDPFKVVEIREKRLRKGTTGKEIQYFKKKGKSKISLL